MKNDPIDNIEWRSVESLSANHYNPNIVFNQELQLLEHSLMSTGWIQPILINMAGVIIDGFHRWSLSKSSPRIRARWAGQVPCAVIDVPEHEAMMMTVRINRAKGTHSAVSMSSLVKILIDDLHCDRQEVATGIGANLDEVDLLYQDSIFKSLNLQDYKFSQAWEPRANNK
jgi:ParB-like chromosome segregation protein Spo0J